MKVAVNLLWVLLSLLGALALAHVVGVVNPNEKVNGLWLVVAAACIYVLAYRFYGRWLARQVVGLNNQHVTPAVRLNDGVNFHPTNKVVLFGHHFAAIAGAGPLLGPVLAAQFGFVPGFLWLVIGAVLAGAVQDFIILVASMRRNGRSLPEIAHDELGSITGTATAVAVLFIVVVALAGLGLRGGECALPQCLGHVHDRDDDSDRSHHGLLSPEVSSRCGGGSVDPWRGAADRRRAVRPCGRAVVLRVALRVRQAGADLAPGWLWFSCLGAARLDVAGAAWLSLHLHETRRGLSARVWRDSHGADDRDAACDTVCAMAAGQLFPARSSRFSSSRLPAGQSRVSTRWSRPARRRR